MTMAAGLARDAAAMTVVAPDFARRIDLPGVGPCPRPVDIDRSTTGFSELVSLRVYSFAKDMVIHGEAEDDEVFVVLIRGMADIAVDSAGSRVGDFALRADGGSRVVYLPPHAAYHLTALADCDIAYARAEPPLPRSSEARGFAPVGSRLDITNHATGMALLLATVPAGETIAVAGRGGTPSERFVHVRFDDGGAATISGKRLGDWDSVVLGHDARATITIEDGVVDVLIIDSASACGGTSPKT